MCQCLAREPGDSLVRPAAISVGPAALPTFSGSKGTSQSAAFGTTTAVRRKRPNDEWPHGVERFSNRRSRRAVTAARRARRDTTNVDRPAGGIARREMHV